MTLDEVRKVQLGALEQLLSYCADNHLRVFLSFGTLLGAVRHRGYIPWDDDIDVMMPRADFDVLRRLWGQNNDAGPYALRTVGDEGWPFPYAKLMHSRTCVRESTLLPVSLGVGIDIFPIDASPGSRIGRGVMIAACIGLRTLSVLQSLVPSQSRALSRQLLLKVLQPIARRIPRYALIQARTRVATALNWRQEPSRLGAFVTDNIWSVPAAALSGSRLLSFESRSCPVPSGFDVVLRAMYGDTYLELPPPHLRVTHHQYTASWLES